MGGSNGTTLGEFWGQCLARRKHSGVTCRCDPSHPPRESCAACLKGARARFWGKAACCLCRQLRTCEQAALASVRLQERRTVLSAEVLLGIKCHWPFIPELVIISWISSLTTSDQECWSQNQKIKFQKDLCGSVVLKMRFTGQSSDGLEEESVSASI